MGEYGWHSSRLCCLTSGMSRKQKWRGLCACKGRDAFDCRLHSFVRRHRDCLDAAFSFSHPTPTQSLAPGSRGRAPHSSQTVEMPRSFVPPTLLPNPVSRWYTSQCREDKATGHPIRAEIMSGRPMQAANCAVALLYRERITRNCSAERKRAGTHALAASAMARHRDDWRRTNLETESSASASAAYRHE